ncbi:zinc finger protein basonuclin-1-like [Xyrauchen texanus]|uniref:zinc finger protein basonuclin-1-like n=1 Tax=Xyrauchen texanus TaxID=154827 RepID=UPI0022422CFD|nr:zinc finger protein basonuclin-1-like [Xyrauchen texanus]
MMFSSLRSRNRHSANPNPRLHASAQHPTQLSIQPRRSEMFVAQPFMNTTPPVSMSTRLLVSTANNNTVMTDQLKHQSGSGSGGGTGHLTANQNGLADMIDMMPKKKRRKSSTPLKIKRENRHDNHDEDDKDDKRFKLPVNKLMNSRSQRQSLSSLLAGNKHHSINNPISYSVSDQDCYDTDL